ncbi:hypothetical protein AMATHDRAFT_140877 [Amanita thiersii Skay4041]|uniref:Phosphoribulokinase/uridine kinase domain-containing protein n=1 Tax=Amanita thiersii Skay4041 TaxID=703135 RepID=A0A2A9NWN3_9AGAR|nr:hypothetical protein AMATHDRAFT_140877 [Amanita thiersii Skay4041]
MSIIDLISSRILAQLKVLQHRPLFVALQGPQGSGKTYAANLLRGHLSAPPHNLHVAILSIDDLYLPHSALRSLADSNPHNCLWNGRGQPGTHDIDLGVRVFESLRDGVSDVELPRFDKSLHNGEGDRLPMDGNGVVVKQPPCLDVVILEGWCVGFYPISSEELERRWQNQWKQERKLLGLEENEVARLGDIVEVNEKLRDYVRLWNFIDLFIQIKPVEYLASQHTSQYSIIYKWRLEQEHYMKAMNGGRGMSDKSVKTFVDRYIPGYVFFGERAPDETVHTEPKWVGKGLTIFIDEDRKPVSFSTL